MAPFTASSSAKSLRITSSLLAQESADVSVEGPTSSTAASKAPISTEASTIYDVRFRGLELRGGVHDLRSPASGPPAPQRRARSSPSGFRASSSGPTVASTILAVRLQTHELHGGEQGLEIHGGEHDLRRRVQGLELRGGVHDLHGRERHGGEHDLRSPASGPRAPRRRPRCTAPRGSWRRPLRRALNLY